MKKGLFLLFAFLFKATVFTALSEEFIEKATVFMPDKTHQIHYLYNAEKELIGYYKMVQSGSTAWANVDYVLWERDNSGRKVMEATKLWQSNSWKLSQQIDFEYDSEDNKVREILSVANASGILEKRTRTQWTYAGGVLTRVSVDEWRNGAWAPQSLSEYVYNGNQLAQVKFGNYTASSLNAVSRTNFAYNILGKLETQTLQTKIAGSDPEEFENEMQDLFIYDENGKEILKISQRWNNGEWRKAVRMVSEYDAYGDLTVRTLQNHGQVWNNATQEVHLYDSAGTLIEKQHRSWIFKMWLDIFNENYVYDNNGNTQTAEFNRMFWTGTLAPKVVSHIPLSYNNSVGVVSPAQTDLISAQKIEVAYANPEDLLVHDGNDPTTNNPDVAIQILLYPNPSPDGYFYFNSFENILYSYEVYDMFGRLIVTRTYNNGYIDLSHVPPGMYNAVLHTNAGTAVRKLIRK